MVSKTNKHAQVAVDCFLSRFIEALDNGDSASLVGFGRFKMTERKALKDQNPHTGEKVKIKPQKLLFFKCSLMFVIIK